jgi:hypothetical protein
LYPSQKTFEIWQSVEGDCIATTVCLAGPGGDQARAMLEPGAILKLTYQAYSELDQMQKYYDYMGFGPYHSEWPDLAVRPYHFIEAIENLTKLKKTLHPLRQIIRRGDGSTTPIIPDPLPLITVQDKAVFSVGIWIRSEFGGHIETPTNEAELIGLVETHIRAVGPEHLEHVQSAAFICPLEFAAQMQWPLDGRDPAESKTNLKMQVDK